jgi:hypothetical protein
VNVMCLVMPAAALLLILDTLGAIIIAQWAQWIPVHKMLNHTTEMLSREAGPILWPGRSWELTLLDNGFWDYVTEHNYIWPFGILLMEWHTEIEHVLRPALFMDCIQHEVVIPFRCFWIANRFHLQGSRCPSRTCLDSSQPAHTGCLLEEVTVNELI